MRLRTRKAKIVVKIDDVTVHTEPMTPQEMTRFRADRVTITGVGAEAVETVARNFGEDMFCRVVTGWDGAEDADGKPLPCSDKNKRLVYRHDQQFAADVMTAMYKALAAREDLLAKN